jgi:hypothetical protein
VSETIDSPSDEIARQYAEIITWDEELVALLKAEGLSMKAANLAIHTGAYCQDVIIQLSGIEDSPSLTEEQIRYLPILRDYCGSIQRIVFGEYPEYQRT